MPVEERLERVWADPPGFIGRLRALQNDVLGTRIMVTSFVFFLIAGVFALLMRLQLIAAEFDFIGPEFYNRLFTMHGSTMMFLFAVPMLEGFAIFLLPFVLGNREMPFPRLGAFSWWTFLLGGILFFSSFLFNAVPDDGWFAYVPLSGPRFSPGLEMDFWLLGLGVAEVAAIAAGVEIIIAILVMRAPGMTLSRLPILAWAYLAMAFSILFAFTTLFVTTLMLEGDRHFGTQFFNPGAGGSPLLWQHLFWVFGHPEVYIQFLPATGMVSMIVPVFARRPLVGYNYVVASLVAVGFLSFALWAHHMFTVGMPQVANTFFSAASILIAIPAGIQIFAWIATLWAGRPTWRVPLLYVVGFLLIFVLGGITGVMVGVVPFDWQVHDSYFVVAHFHYVLIGGVTFPLFAAFYYWIPKFSGRMLNERAGKWGFWLKFVGFNVTFFPQHFLGFLGMPRRVYTYEAGLGWDIYNLISTVGAFILAAGVLLFIVNVVASLRAGQPAGDNPWGADSLEWATTSPPANYGFAELPQVRSRHPLWEQGDVFAGNDRVNALLEGLKGWPLTWRAALSTSIVDAHPREIFRVAAPSIWPLVTAVGLITIFAAEIFMLRVLVLGGALLILAGLVGWHWPERIEETERERRFEQEHGVIVHPNGSPTVNRWAMRLFILLLAIVLSVFLFSYFYLRLESVAWPPDNLPLPELVLPGIATAFVFAAAIAARIALGRIRRGGKGGLLAFLVAVIVFGAIAAGLIAVHVARLPFDQTLNAYASIFIVLAGYLVALAAIGAGQALFILLAGVLRNRYSARVHVGVELTWMYWAAAVVIWLVGAGVLFLAPQF
jgi:cytochrome c oxidase subunit I+III